MGEVHAARIAQVCEQAGGERVEVDLLDSVPGQRDGSIGDDLHFRDGLHPLSDRSSSASKARWSTPNAVRDSWYRTAIPEAERLYEDYLDERKREARP
ncbi:MAG: hypothetical protein QG671_516 [Actinomycetota bacterium]|nr:hypothetical protein [Actinomycetota bacterium]